ncbi:MAG: S1 family peptidase [Pseudomonadota bacterium]
MRRIGEPGWAFGLLIVLATSCGPDASEMTSWMEPASAESAIVNGTREPQTVALSDRQIRAIGWLYDPRDPSFAFCTGTLISPRIVVTAEHCVSGTSPGSIGFGVGQDPATAEDLVPSVAAFANPDHDVALLLLERDLIPGKIAIEPLPFNLTPVDSTLVGHAVQAGGYGETRDPLRSGRWFATVYVSELSTDEIVVDGRGIQGICYGDSGSALIDLDAQGQPFVLAVESWGDDTCTGIDHLARLDLVQDWMMPILAGEYPPDPCQGVSAEGRCDGDIALSCRNSNLVSVDCTTLGTTCSYVATAERFACTCGDLTDVGRCAGDILETCRDGRISSSDCAGRGRSCGFDSARGSYRCIDAAVCRPEDEGGRCEGDTLISCTASVTSRELCGVNGQRCEATSVGFACVAPVQDAGPAADSGDDSPPPAGDGCGCGIQPGSPAGNGVALVLLLGLPLVARRRFA